MGAASISLSVCCLTRAGRAGLELVREFLLDAWLSAKGSPETPTAHGGFLFRRRG